MNTPLHPRSASSRLAQARNDNTPEHELIVTAQAGVTDAMDTLLARHRSALYRAARRFSCCPDEIDDLVQDTMLRAFVKIRTFRGEAQFSTWLTAILNNSAVSRKRKKPIQWVSIDDHIDQPVYSVIKEIPDSRRNPEQEAIREELLLVLRAALHRRPSKDQKVLMTCVLNEVPICDVARNTGTSVASVRSRLFRAKRALSESFRRRGIAPRRLNAAHCGF